VGYSKYILTLVIALLFIGMSSVSYAQDTLSQPRDMSHTPPQEYNPKPAIFHHIADSHEFGVLEQFAFPLPCIIYSSAAGGLTTFLYREGKEVNGYACIDGNIVRADGASFLDLSITRNVFTMLLAAAILIIVFTSVAGAYKANHGKAPKGMQSVIEPLFVFMRDEVAKPSIGPKYEVYMPYIMTIFFFILTLNLLGLVPVFPGGANVTGNISFTLVLAFVSFLAINFSGTKHYWGHIFWMPGVAVPMKIFLAVIEVIGVFTKPIALMIRLFANMTAGHIIVLSLISLIFVFGKAGASMIGSGLGATIAVPFTLFISCIEVLIAFIQAFVFAMLTAVFIGMALEDHSEGAHTVD
jgi:F-type H+-transporting ATPase subunit a